MNLDYVNTNVGGIGHLLKATHPTVYRPNGIVGVTPQFDPAVKDRYLVDHIHGFPVPVNLHRNAASPSLMPVTGSPAPAIENSVSIFDHDFEKTASRTSVPGSPREAIQNGGELTLDMGPRPNKAWGSRPEDAPPSMSGGSRT